MAIQEIARLGKNVQEGININNYIILIADIELHV